MTTLSFLYQDQYLFALYKPAGLHSVRIEGGAGGDSLADHLLKIYPDLASVAKTTNDAGLISRLDRDTSGVIIGAFSASMWEKLYKSLLKGSVQKTYIALVEGRFSEATSFSSYIGSPNRGARKMKVYERRPAKSARALPGTTYLVPLSYDAEKHVSLVKISASPARRHQVRAHSAYIGHPLVGDALYDSMMSVAEFVRTPRSFLLHSVRASLEHPVTGERLTFEAPLETELLAWNGQPPLGD